MNIIKNLFVFLWIAILGAPLYAVTDKEMEEAKTIAAQTYLRYANDGSGYLDDVKATTMAQLESKLKAKEKENLEAFKAVKVPTDYASWDKARLVEFWSVTFFASPNLSAKGKVGRNRVKSRINAMTIATPSAAKPEPAKETAKEDAQKTPETKPAAPEETGDAASLTNAQKEQEVIEKQEEILADQEAIAKDEQDRHRSKQSSNTWVYVIILIILIGLVIWLVVFAANMMKKQAEPLERAGLGANSKEMERLQDKYNSAKETMEQYRSAFEDEKKQNQSLRNEIKVLKEQLAVLQSAHRNTPSQSQPRRTAVAEPRRTASNQQAAPRESRRSESEYPAPKKSYSEFYLGRVNNRGLFVRADRQFNPGHSIYRLETRDGLVGTFHVVDRPEVTDLVLDRPGEYLGGGCTAIDLEDTANADRIITENAGTAVFEGGAWKVLRRSRIRYE